MNGPEIARIFDFVACVLGVLLLIVGASTWIARRARVMRVFFAIIGCVMLTLIAHYVSTWQGGAVLARDKVFALHVVLDWVIVMGMIGAWAEYRAKNKQIGGK